MLQTYKKVTAEPWTDRFHVHNELVTLRFLFIPYSRPVKELSLLHIGVVV